jgi:hypothetical protein
VCGRLKGLILDKNLIFPQSRESAEVRAWSYSSSAYRPYSARAITSLSKWENTGKGKSKTLFLDKKDIAKSNKGSRSEKRLKGIESNNREVRAVILL